MPAVMRIAWKVIFDAVWHFSEDDGFAMASHVALSTLLAIFPFLIFGTALASFLGADQFATTAVHFIFDTWPESIAKPISDEVVQVLTIPRGGLLTISVLAAAYFASNGVEALRISLNRAYRVSESRAWYKTRIASLGFVLAGVLVLAIVSILLVAVPLAIRYAGTYLPLFNSLLTMIDSWSLVGVFIMLTSGLAVSHLWLPDGRRKIMDVLPGILVTLLLWTIGAYVFASYLATFANYASTYAGLASIMVVLVFLYMVGAIFIIGAEFNAAIMKFKVKRMVLNHIRGPKEDPASDATQPVVSLPVVASPIAERPVITDISAAAQSARQTVP